MWIGQYIVPAVQYGNYDETLVHIAVVYITVHNLQNPIINLSYFTWLYLLDLINTILMKLCGLNFIMQFNKPIRRSRLCNIVNKVSHIYKKSQQMLFFKTFRLCIVY